MKKALLMFVIFLSFVNNGYCQSLVQVVRSENRGTTIFSGEVSGSTSASNLPNVPGYLCLIKAVKSNAGNVYIGSSAVTVVNGTTDTTTGIELGAGEITGWLPCTNLNQFYIISDNATDDITYVVAN